MNCLAVDTSGNHLTILIFKGEEVFCSFKEDIGLKHSLTLMEEVEALLLKANLSLDGVDVFSAVVGPGSFTGIRIGVSAVKAFAYANNKKVLSVTSFDTLAYNSKESNVLAVIDARHDNYYIQKFIENKPQTPAFVSLDELKELALGFTVLSSTNLPIEHKIVSVKDGLIEAIKANISNQTEDREVLVPLYVKKSQAEEELKW